MLSELMFFEFIFLELIFKNSLFEFVWIWHFIVDGWFNVCVGFVMQIVEQMVDVLVGIGGQMDFIVSENEW